MKEKKRPFPPPEPVASPFASLAGLATAKAVCAPAPVAPPAEKPKAARGRVDVLRSTAHRGGKTVTVLKGFVDVHASELQSLTRQLQKRCSAGGTLKDGVIEIQGDHREAVMRFLTDAGFRPVKAGG